MPATAAATDIGFATILAKKTGPTTYAPIVEMTDFGFPEYSRDSVDYTHFGSPDRFREHKPGLADAGDLTFSYALIPGVADDATVAASFASLTVEEWRVTFPNGATFDVKGFATKHSRAVPMDDKMVGSATFKVSGKPVLTPAV
jgi:hypothetical protein